MPRATKAPKAPKEPKVAKKTFEYLDKAETRKVAVQVMHHDLALSFRATTKDLSLWITENQRLLVDADLTILNPNDFRPGVVEFLMAIQDYLGGTRPTCPEWNEGAVPDDPTAPKEEEEDPTESHPLTTETDDDDDEEEPAELVEFPDYTNTPPVAPEKKMSTPTPTLPMRMGAPAGAPPPIGFRPKVSSPIEEPAPAPAAPPEVAAPMPAPPVAQPPAELGGTVSPDELHALIEMVSETSQQVAELPQLITGVQDQLGQQMEGLSTRINPAVLAKKVDDLGSKVRDLANEVAGLSNAMLLMLNYYRPLGAPYATLAEVPSPDAYWDYVSTPAEGQE